MLRIDDIPQQVADDIQGYALIFYVKYNYERQSHSKGSTKRACRAFGVTASFAYHLSAKGGKTLDKAAFCDIIGFVEFKLYGDHNEQFEFIAFRLPRIP